VTAAAETAEAVEEEVERSAEAPKGKAKVGKAALEYKRDRVSHRMRHVTVV